VARAARGDAQEGRELADERAGDGDAEADAEAPGEADEDDDDFVPEELGAARERGRRCAAEAGGLREGWRG
jgi:hypothetical protein